MNYQSKRGFVRPPSAHLYSTLAHGDDLDQRDRLHVFLRDPSAPCPADATAASFSSPALLLLQDAASSSPALLQDASTKPNVISHFYQPFFVEFFLFAERLDGIINTSTC